MTADLTGAHTARIHRDDLVIEARKAPLILGQKLRIKTRLPVSRYRQLQRPVIRQNRLLSIAIAAVAATAIA